MATEEWARLRQERVALEAFCELLVEQQRQVDEMRAALARDRRAFEEEKQRFAARQPSNGTRRSPFIDHSLSWDRAYMLSGNLPDEKSWLGNRGGGRDNPLPSTDAFKGIYGLHERQMHFVGGNGRAACNLPASREVPSAKTGSPLEEGFYFGYQQPRVVPPIPGSAQHSQHRTYDRASYDIAAPLATSGIPLAGAEAREAVSNYNMKWTALDSTDTEIPYPTPTASPTVLTTTLSPIVSGLASIEPNIDPPSTWSPDTLIRLNVCAFFLAGFGIPLDLTTDRRRRTPVLGPSHDAGSAKVAALIRQLKTEKRRWHSDMLRRRGESCVNEVSSAVFYAVTELCERCEEVLRRPAQRHTAEFAAARRSAGREPFMQSDDVDGFAYAWDEFGEDDDGPAFI